MDAMQAYRILAWHGQLSPKLVSCPAGGWLGALGLGLLCILGCLADRSYATSQAAGKETSDSTRHVPMCEPLVVLYIAKICCNAGLRKRYAVRLAESCGAGLGALAIPWLLAALVAGAWSGNAGEIYWWRPGISIS